MTATRQLILLIVVLACLTAIPLTCVAQSGSVQCTGTGDKKFCFLTNTENSQKLSKLYATDPGALATFIGRLFAIALSVGGMLAVLRLGWAGYLYMTSESWSSKGRAKEVIGDTVLGLVLLLAIYLILYQINPNILKLEVLNDLKALQTEGSAAAP